MAGQTQDTQREEAARKSYVRARRVGTRAWALIGCCGVFVLAVLALGRIWPAVELLLVGVIIGFICSPITNALESHGVGRALGAFLALVVVLAVLVAIIVLLGPPFVTQLIEVLQRVPTYVNQVRGAIATFWSNYGSSKTADVQASLDQYVNTFASVGTNASSQMLQNLTSGIVTNVFATVSNLFTFFLGLVVAYWLAKDYPVITREFSVIAGPSHSDELSVLLAVVSRSMGGYMRGIVITSATGGLLSFIGFVLIGHPYAGLMGITVGIFHFVPVIGPWIAAALAALLALFVSPWLGLFSLIVSVVAQNVTDNLISPLVMRSAVKIHPALSLFGLVLGEAVGGILGMALAIPLTAAVRSVFVFYFETRTGRQLVSYDGALFKSTPFHDEQGAILPSFDALDDDSFFESTRLVTPSSRPVAIAAERPQHARRTIGEVLSDALGKGTRADGDSTQVGPKEQK